MQLVHTELLPLLHVTGLVQLAIAVHVAQTSGLPSTRYVPLVHDVHCEFVALVHVRPDVHPLTELQAWQVPLFRKKPAAQLVQTESDAVVHVSGLVQ